VLIADPDPLARRAIRDALDGAGGFAVPAEASLAADAIELCRYYEPDVATLEIGFPDADGLVAAREIAEAVSTVRILVFSREDELETQLRALAAGASGFLSKNTPVDGIAPALETLARSEAVVTPRTALYLIERLRTMLSGGVGMRPIISPLTQRQWEIVDLLSQGMDTHEIASALVLTEETVYSHIKSLLRKLRVHSRDEAVAVAEAMRDPLGTIVWRG
jgi:DNA-binding NarL/FixJ family response regulator